MHVNDGSKKGGIFGFFSHTVEPAKKESDAKQHQATPQYRLRPAAPSGRRTPLAGCACPLGKRGK